MTSRQKLLQHGAKNPVLLVFEVHQGFSIEVVEEVVNMDTAIGKVQTLMERIQRDPALRRSWLSAS
jgi:hypothetical protein